MSNYLNVNIPTFFAGMDTGFLYDGDPSPTNEIVPVEVFMYTSIPQRCGLFSVMTEYGSQHARVPVHYLRSLEVEPENYTAYPLDWVQLWDNISYYASVNIIDYCKNHDLDIENVGKLITKSLKEKIQIEAEESNLMKPKGRLPL